MSTKFDTEIRHLPLNTQVLARLRPEITDTVTRVNMPGGHAIGLLLATMLTIYWVVSATSAPSMWWFIFIPLLGVFFHGLCIWEFYDNSKNLVASGEYLKKHPEMKKTESPVKNKDLHQALIPLNELTKIPDHRILAFHDEGHLAINLMDRSFDRVIGVNIGTTSALNTMDDAHECADLIIQGARDLTSFYAATDAFTRPPRLPGSKERMSIEPVDAEHYLADGQTVESPGYDQISKDVAIACWEPWRARSLSLHLDNLAEQKRRDEWLEDTKQETIDRIQGKADDQLVARRQAHLERISQED